MKTFTAYIEYDTETQLYVGVIPGVTGAHSQGASLDELKANLAEALELCLEDYKERGELDSLPRFVGLQQDAQTSSPALKRGRGKPPEAAG